MKFPPRHNERVSKNFVIGELLKSETADRHGIDNVFSSEKELSSAIFLTNNILQPLRDEFGSFSPNSVYRSQALERALKHKPKRWISKSQHAKGEAADVEIAGVSNLDLARWIKDNLEFDQLILECHDPKAGPHSGWVHISRKASGNRGEVLSYVKQGRKYRYVLGLVHA